MNIGRIKTLCWISVLALGSYLGWDVYDFISVGKGMLKNISKEEQLAVLTDIPEIVLEKRRIVPYKDVNRIFFDLNWTGKQPTKIVDPGPGPIVPEKRPKKPVADLLTVVLINYASDPQWSNASVHYKLNADERLMMQNSEVVLFEGEKLPGKYSFITLASIRPEYVEFTFEVPEGEEAREAERVMPPEYQTDDGSGVLIAQIGEDGVLLVPDRENLIPIDGERPTYNYNETIEVRSGQFLIGRNDAATFGRDYARILSTEVRTDRYKDPDTKRYSGILISSISSGSIISAHGLKAGDIIKSINGDPVTSTQEAISYVKTNSDVTTHWVAVVERQGKNMSLTYDYTPEN